MALPSNISYYRRIDSQDMIGLLERFPQQCCQSFELAETFSLPKGYKRFKNIVFSGMGGSAIAADLIRSLYLYKINHPVFVIRNYRIPEFLNRGSLFFACSYSGNTEETLASFQEAKKRKARIIAICSGGKLLESARKNRIPYLILPEGYPPRQALGYFFFSFLNVLERLDVVDNLDREVYEAISVLENLKKKCLSVNIDIKNNPAKKLACGLKHKFPVIYSSCDYLDVVVNRWRGQFAENSKTLSSVNVFPEMNHNEIVGWRFPRKILKNFAVIILRDVSEHKRVAKRIEITKNMLIKKGFGVKEIWSHGNSLMARLFSLIYIGDFTSFYLAILNKVDPTPVEPIAYLKKKLAKG
jgi:glucose/mannose-6-phosphate isomerase